MGNCSCTLLNNSDRDLHMKISDQQGYMITIKSGESIKLRYENYYYFTTSDAVDMFVVETIADFCVCFISDIRVGRGGVANTQNLTIKRDGNTIIVTTKIF